MMNRRRQYMRGLLGLLGLVIFVASTILLLVGMFFQPSLNFPTTTPSTAGSGSSDEMHPVQIRTLEGPPRVLTGMTGPDGLPVTAACSTCHSTRQPNSQTRSGDSLKEFHQGLKMGHGQLSCLSCHNPDDYDTLHLADGKAVQYQNVMQLCAQCHGPQYRDYLHGSHGGMTGYWDRTKGPRQRNNCVDCHDAHSPAYPQFNPVFPPKDHFRGGNTTKPNKGEHHE